LEVSIDLLHVALVRHTLITDNVADRACLISAYVTLFPNILPFVYNVKRLALLRTCLAMLFPDWKLTRFHYTAVFFFVQ